MQALGGVRCARCGELIDPIERWDLGTSTMVGRGRIRALNIRGATVRRTIAGE
jgi:hypothetical protein